MRSLVLVSLLFFLSAGLAFGAEDRVSQAFGGTDQPGQACKYCGMNLLQFAHSRMYITYDDGSTVGLCSLHCAAVDLALNIDRTPTAIRVGDHASKRLIDAETATWLIDEHKPGVMTSHAKWAFETLEGAEKHLQEHGGRIISFAEATKAAYEDMHRDNQMLRDKRVAARGSKANTSQVQVTPVASAQPGQMGKMGKGRRGGRGHCKCKMRHGGMSAPTGQTETGASAPGCH